MNLPTPDAPKPNAERFGEKTLAALPAGFVAALALFPAAWAEFTVAAAREGNWELLREAIKAGRQIKDRESFSTIVASALPILANTGRLEDVRLVSEMLGSLPPGVAPGGDLPPLSAQETQAWSMAANLAAHDSRHWKENAQETFAALFGGEAGLRTAGRWDKQPLRAISLSEHLVWGGCADIALLRAWGAGDKEKRGVLVAFAPEKTNGVIGAQNMTPDRNLERLAPETIEWAWEDASRNSWCDRKTVEGVLSSGVMTASPAIQTLVAATLEKGLSGWMPQEEGAALAVTEAFAHGALKFAKNVAETHGEDGAQAWEAWIGLAERWAGAERFLEMAMEPWSAWALPWGLSEIALTNACKTIAFSPEDGSFMSLAVACDALGRRGWASEALAKRGLRVSARHAEWAKCMWESARGLSPAEIVAPLGRAPGQTTQRGQLVEDVLARSLAAYEALSLSVAVKGGERSGIGRRPPRSL